MAENVVQIDSHTNFSGYRGSLPQAGGILKEKDSEVRSMEITQKEYIDQRIDSLEKSIDHRFDSSEKILSGKMDHLATRLEDAINNQNTKLDAKFELIQSSINNQDTKLDGKIDLMKSNLDHSLDVKLNAFKEDFSKSQKNTRNNIIVWTLGGGAILATLGVAIVQAILN